MKIDVQRARKRKCCRVWSSLVCAHDACMLTEEKFRSLIDRVSSSHSLKCTDTNLRPAILLSSSSIVVRYGKEHEESAVLIFLYMASSEAWQNPSPQEAAYDHQKETLRQSPVCQAWADHPKEQKRKGKVGTLRANVPQQGPACTHQAAHEGRYPPEAYQMPSLRFRKCWPLEVLQAVEWIRLQVLEACLPLPYLAPRFPPNLLSLEGQRIGFEHAGLRPLLRHRRHPSGEHPSTLRRGCEGRRPHLQ